jgi:dTDP-4-amino-4,6-dideoxygalactose transaminase
MVAITATNSATPSLQAALGRAKLAQAQNEASQAEDNAKQLRTQANEAEQQAQQSQNRVAQVANSNRQQDSTYGAPLQPSQPRVSEVPVKVQKFIENLYRSTNPQRIASGNALKSNADSPPVINSQGQATGRILNLSA